MKKQETSTEEPHCLGSTEAPCYTKDSDILRSLLWLNHGHAGLYGADGEMQCPQCALDFKRDSVERICEVFVLRGMKLMEEVNNKITKQQKCCVCGTTENLHKDGWHGYRCGSQGCVCF